MKIAILGAGFAGLAAGIYLSERGRDVTIFEREEKPGGLTVGFREQGWSWHLEKHYHHIFVSDWAIRNLAAKVGHNMLFRRPKTSIYINSSVYQFDSAKNLLTFSPLSFWDRLRVGVILFYLKINPVWKPLEKITAFSFLRKTMGKKGWEVLWRPLFDRKFGKYARKIPASWFWARVKKRSSELGYPIGGFESFANSCERKIKRDGGTLFYNSQVASLYKQYGKFVVKTGGKEYLFDRVICTLPNPLFIKVTKGLPAGYKKSLTGLKGLAALNLVVSLNKQFLSDGTYWLNINEKDFPFLGVMEQTNFIDRIHYGGSRIIYVGNYLEPGHRYLQMSSSDLVEEFLPYLRKINPAFAKSWIKKAYVFKAYFAQPIIPLNYSKTIPNMKTPIDGLYLANIGQVYPWDRGTNYAVELGNKAAKLCVSEKL